MRAAATACRLAAILWLLPVTAVGQSVFLHTSDETSGGRDARLIIRSTDHRPPKLGDAPDEYLGASIILACGDRFPSDSGRSLLMYAGEPLEPFGTEEAYVEIRLDGGKPQRIDLPILDHGFYPLVNSGGRSNRYLAFFRGKSPYYNAALLKSMLIADTAELTYRTFDRTRTVRFPLQAMRQIKDSIPTCSWP
jgi:hypothetical protein